MVIDIVVIIHAACMLVVVNEVYYIIVYYMWLDSRKSSLSAQEMKFNLLLIIKPTLLHYLKISST